MLKTLVFLFFFLGIFFLITLSVTAGLVVALGTGFPSH